MRFNFCGTELSPSCKHYMDNHFCLDSCDPYMMPYYNRIRREFYEVPLCEASCKSWFQACGQEQFCARNLVIQYKWQFNKTFDGIVNNCYKGAECRPVSVIYDNHKDFCETIFNGFYKIQDGGKCVHMNFDVNKNNPNASLHQPLLIFSFSLAFTAASIPIALYLLWTITRSNF